MLRKIFYLSSSACLRSGTAAGSGLRVSVWKNLVAETSLVHRNNSLIRYFSSPVDCESAFTKGRKFEEFEGISPAALDVFKRKGFEFSFPVQDATWKKVMDGKSLIVREKTGAGKTLGYVLPAIEKLRLDAAANQRKGKRTPKILVLVPTRELCIQVTNQFAQILSRPGEFYVCSLYGGASIVPQLDMLERGVDIVVATPGRLSDVLGREAINTSNIDMVVLDETDQMLDIGFADKITEIVREIKSTRSPNSPGLQCLLFSATVPKWVQEASRKLMDSKPEFINLVSDDDMKTPASVQHLALQVRNMQSANEMIPYFLTKYLKPNGRAIIFTNTKHECDEVNSSLRGVIDSKILNGDVTQSQREKTFNLYKTGKLRCLVATNVAARGLDFPQVDLVVQLSPPQDIESYVHRAGRTARAGNSGVCITFYTRRDAHMMVRISSETGAQFEQLDPPRGEELENLKRIESDLTAEDKVDLQDTRQRFESREPTRQQSSYDDTIEGFTRVQFDFGPKSQIEESDIDSLKGYLRENCGLGDYTRDTKKLGLLKYSKGFVAMIPQDKAVNLEKFAFSLEGINTLGKSGITVSFPSVRPRTVNPFADRNQDGQKSGSFSRQPYTKSYSGNSRFERGGSRDRAGGSESRDSTSNNRYQRDSWNGNNSNNGNRDSNNGTQRGSYRNTRRDSDENYS